MAKVESLAKQLHFHRLKFGAGADFNGSLAEAYLFSAYNLAPILDVEGVISVDDSGRFVKTIWRQSLPFRVCSDDLWADVYGFVLLPDYGKPEVVGWMTRAEIEEAPVHWVEKDGKRVDYAHEIERRFVNPLPEKFDFTPCKHESFNQMWSYEYGGAWECFGCNRLIHNSQDRKRIPAQEAGLQRRDRDQNSERTPWDQPKNPVEAVTVEPELYRQDRGGPVGSEPPRLF